MQMRKKLYNFKYFEKSKKLFFCQYLSFSVWFLLKFQKSIKLKPPKTHPGAGIYRHQSNITKLPCKGTLQQVFICMTPPLLLSFCLRWCLAIVYVLNLVRYSVLNSCRIWSTTELNTPHLLPAKHCPHILYFDTRKGGGEVGTCWTREDVRGATVHKAGSKIQTWLTGYPVNKLW